MFIAIIQIWPQMAGSLKSQWMQITGIALLNYITRLLFLENTNISTCIIFVGYYEVVRICRRLDTVLRKSC